MDRDERQRIASQTNALIHLQVVVSICGFVGVIAGLVAGAYILADASIGYGLVAIVVLPLVGAYLGRRLGISLWANR